MDVFFRQPKFVIVAMVLAVVGYADDAQNASAQQSGGIVGNRGVLWQRTFGGPGQDRAESVLATADGGVIVVGRSERPGFGGGRPTVRPGPLGQRRSRRPVANRPGSPAWDILVVKLNAAGRVEWSRTLGGPTEDAVEGSVTIKPFGKDRFLIGAWTRNAPFGLGSYDFLAIVIDSQGRVQSARVYGGRGAEKILAVDTAPNGSAILAGWTHSNMGVVPNGVDCLITQIDRRGRVMWSACYGGGRQGDRFPVGRDDATAILQLDEGGYFVGGFTHAFGAGREDFYALRLTAGGKLVWSVALGGPQVDEAYAAAFAPDGGLVLAGRTASFGAGQYDMAVISLDASGRLRWARTLGTPGVEEAWDVCADARGYLVAGRWAGRRRGDSDAIIVALDQSGRVRWSGLVGGPGAQHFRSVTVLPCGGLCAVGQTWTPAAGTQMLVVRMNQPGGGASARPENVTSRRWDSIRATTTPTVSVPVRLQVRDVSPDVLQGESSGPGTRQ